MQTKVIFLIAILLTANLSLAQSNETRSLETFNKVSVGQAITLKLIPGNKNEAVLEVSGADAADVLTEIFGNRLNIKMRGNRNYNNVDVIVYLTFKEISALDVSSSAEVTSSQVIKSINFDVSVSSAGRAKLALECESLTVEISSSGKLELTGEALRQNINISSSGKYAATKLESKEVDIEVSSSGSAEIYVTSRIDASANSAGSIYYSGNPEKVFVDANSGGKVKKS
jgi:hypothetical protein